MAEKELAAATGLYTADSVPNTRKLKKALLKSAERTISQQEVLVRL
jgi:hypothetical protein